MLKVLSAWHAQKERLRLPNLHNNTRMDEKKKKKKKKKKSFTQPRTGIKV